MLKEIEKCKARGVYVALSIDGTKKSGRMICNLPTIEGLFEEEKIEFMFMFKFTIFNLNLLLNLKLFYFSRSIFLTLTKFDVDNL